MSSGCFVEDLKMPEALSDEEVARQILGVFEKRRVKAGGTLRRNDFFIVRDGDFRRGLNKAVENNWIRMQKRDRYTYELTSEGLSLLGQLHT